MVQNRIEKGNLPKPYLIEQSKEEMLREQIDSEVIRAFDCQEESMSNAEFSLNPPPECRKEDGSAYFRHRFWNELDEFPVAGQRRMVWR